METKDSKLPVLDVFSASWCGPCKIVKPILAKLEKDLGSFKLNVIDVDKNIQLARENFIRSVPTIRLNVSNNVSYGYKGSFTEVSIKQWLNQLINEQEKV